MGTGHPPQNKRDRLDEFRGVEPTMFCHCVKRMPGFDGLNRRIRKATSLSGCLRRMAGFESLRLSYRTSSGDLPVGKPA